MRHSKNRQISAYVKGDINTPDYYRIHQYLQSIDEIKVTYHMMLPSCLYRRYVPIRKNGPLIVLLLFILIYIRTVAALLKDVILPPSHIVINRRIMPHKTLFPIWLFFRLIDMRGKTTIIWDFDDDIISMGECSIEDFNNLSFYADHIIVTHLHLANLIDVKYKNKIHILPTTDGDLFNLFQNEDVNKWRIEALSQEIILVWVATSANLSFLKSIIPQLESSAKFIGDTLRKRLRLKVVCNTSVDIRCTYLQIENVKWTKQAAIQSLKEAHIGIMPLEDTCIARGKGGFKLIQYMSIGLPCIGTDVGFNNAIINSTFGRLIPSNDLTQWTNAIIDLADEHCWEEYSLNAFHVWEEKFPFKRNLRFWTNLLLDKHENTTYYN